LHIPSTPHIYFSLHFFVSTKRKEILYYYIPTHTHEEIQFPQQNPYQIKKRKAYFEHEVVSFERRLFILTGIMTCLNKVMITALLVLSFSRVNHLYVDPAAAGSDDLFDSSKTHTHTLLNNKKNECSPHS